MRGQAASHLHGFAAGHPRPAVDAASAGAGRSAARPVGVTANASWTPMATSPSRPSRGETGQLPADRPSGAAEDGPLLDWCLDADTRDHVIARRNVLTGLWAGRLIGLTGADLARYAAGMHRADFEVPGDADIVAALLRDFDGAGLVMTEGMVRQTLAAFHRQALVQTHCTD